MPVPSPIFTPDKIGGEWSAEVNNRRDYFSKRFKRVVKNHFKLGIEYGMYSFRHTYITKLFIFYILVFFYSIQNIDLPVFALTLD